jgi:putative transposase
VSGFTARLATKGRGGLDEKKDRTSRLSAADKSAMLDPDNPKLSLTKQRQLLGVPRSTYYHLRGKAEKESNENLALMRLIDEEYTRHPYYGSRKMRDWLHRNGYRFNRKRVRRLMKK